MKVLVIRQPWAWLIVNGFKPLENRSRRTHYRGPFLIQASSRPEPNFEAIRRKVRERFGIEIPDSRALQYGGIIGAAQLVDCLYPLDPGALPAHAEEWHEPGNFAWMLERARTLPFLRRSGSLGLIDATPEEITHAG
jgi:hypothetical protein